MGHKAMSPLWDWRVKRTPDRRPLGRVKAGDQKTSLVGMTLGKEFNMGSAYQSPWRFWLVSMPVGTWPLAGPTSPGPTSKNKRRGVKSLVGSVGACCRGNPSQRPPSWLGCPVWLQVSVPVPLCRPLCQPALCPVFLGGGSRGGAGVAQAGGPWEP